MIHSLYYASDGVVRTDLPPEEFAGALQDGAGLLWVDFSATPAETDEPILRGVFGFHPLAVDDALRESHVPKVDDWGQYLYLVLHSVVYDHDEENGAHVDTPELDLFVGPNYLVTHHDQPLAPVDRVWSAIQRDERYRRSGVEYILYLLADELVASYMPVVEEMDDAIDHIEDEVFEQTGPKMLARIFVLKRSLLRLRRTIAPQREVLNKLARDDYAVINAKSRIFFRDVYDHTVRLYDITESLRDLVSGVLDTYLSVINNRMNEIMKTLTTITTLFMPISFVASFFGMNFFQPVSEPLKNWTTNPAFLLTMILMIGLPVAMYMWMRRRAWT